MRNAVEVWQSWLCGEWFCCRAEAGAARRSEFPAVPVHEPPRKALSRDRSETVSGLCLCPRQRTGSRPCTLVSSMCTDSSRQRCCSAVLTEPCFQAIAAAYGLIDRTIARISLEIGAEIRCLREFGGHGCDQTWSPRTWLVFLCASCRRQGNGSRHPARSRHGWQDLL